MIDYQFLELLAEKYPNRKAAMAEIVNLRAILALPKGTEYFLSDLHGEHEAFIHMLHSASGVIRSKIEELYGDEISKKERDQLASLIYNTNQAFKAVLIKAEHQATLFFETNIEALFSPLN